MQHVELRPVGDGPSLPELLTLERIDDTLFRSTTFADDRQGLYGGQVMAQSLRAASATVPHAYRAHSLHGYFVRPGSARRPVVFRVSRDRDGRSYAARRVVAIQDGEVLLNLSTSFHVPEEGPDRQKERAPAAPTPEECASHRLHTRAFGVEFRDAEPDLLLPSPARVWARVPDSADAVSADPHLAACLITYISDMCSGLFRLADFDWNVQLTSIDHALWLYRDAAPGWLLMDLAGESVSHGRGLYRGHIFDERGALVAGLAQESLFRKISTRRPHTIKRLTEDP